MNGSLRGRFVGAPRTDIRNAVSYSYVPGFSCNKPSSFVESDRSKYPISLSDEMLNDHPSDDPP
jgi:hypothetical protein